MRSLFIALALLGTSGCFTGWQLGGPWACSAGDVCPEGFSCDEGVCCVPGGTPACSTLPHDNRCPSGREPDVFFFDADGDGDGNEKVPRRFCRAPRGGQWVLSAGDCDDTRADLHSRALEQCNGLDDNCDGVIDEGLSNTTFYRDDDGDLAGDDNARVAACVAPPGYVAVGGDCAPFDPGKRPGAPELCNNVDDNCNDDSDVSETSFADTDNNGSQNFPCLVPGALGECRVGTFQCVSNGQTVQRLCVKRFDPATEICDGLDNDCDGASDEQPECGGPANVFTAPDLVFSAGYLSTAANIATSCQTPFVAAAETLANGNRAWTGSAAGNYHVYSFAKADGGVWDLSRLDAELRMDFGTSTATWGANDAVRDPVVYLCGSQADQFIRYVRRAGSDGLFDGVTSFSSNLSLSRPSGSSWVVGAGSGFDTARVKRVELLLFNNSSFNVTFNTLGFGP